MTNKRLAVQFLAYLSSLGVSHIPKVVPAPAVPSRRPLASGTHSSEAAQEHRADAGVSVRAEGGRRQSGGTSPASVNLVATDIKGAQSGYRSFNPPRALNKDSALVPELNPLTVALRNQSYLTVEERGAALCQLSGVVVECRRCEELADSRRQTVFGVGSPNARIMFMGEAPGAEEDASGEPFVGPAGQLLNRIIQAMGLKREDLYICNILKCRPPGNRNPLPQEAASCREYLDAQIAIVQPEYIVCWGAVAAQNLLGEKRAIGRLRGQFLEYAGARVLCTYHPSYLLRYPAAKVQVWDDMKFLMKDLGVEL